VCDNDRTDRPVVYYKAPTAVHTVERFDIRFFFYYSEDAGPGCHWNDLEGITVTVMLLHHSTGLVTVRISRVSGWAHGSNLFANQLDVTKGVAGEDLSLPITVLVEENKHASAPDRNGDGVFTPGYDVNTQVADAWGVRDAFSSGYMLGATYRSEMTKPRREADRIMANVQGRTSLRRAIVLPTTCRAILMNSENCQTGVESSRATVTH
jgi:hypothetical protein